MNRQSTTPPRGVGGLLVRQNHIHRCRSPRDVLGRFQQRHTLNIFGVYRFATRTSVGATFRAGSNFPIPAYCAAVMAACSSRANAVRSGFPYTAVSTSVRIAASSRSGGA